MSASERSLWERAAEKYPPEARTPELEKKIERKIRQLVREHERQESARSAKAQTVYRPAPPPPDYVQKPDRGLSRGR